MQYDKYIENKSHRFTESGFDPLFLPSCLMDFQRAIVTYSLKTGRAALFEDCGLGKTVQQLVWAENVARKTGGRVLILTPLSVSMQTCKEAEKFGIYAQRSRDGKLPDSQIVITNYEKLHLFDKSDFVGVACDESSILKNVDGVTKAAITEFMKKMNYRSLWTATAAPNDFTELGTSSEALGNLGFVDMLKMFFKNDNNTSAKGGRTQKLLGGSYRFRGHAEVDFWRWVCSWARAIRKPSDYGYDDGKFTLPELTETEHIITPKTLAYGFLIALPAHGMKEQREERSRTVKERCEKAAEIALSSNDPCVCWSYLNTESETLNKLIPGSVELTGSQTDEQKEEILTGFVNGDFAHLVTKPKLAGFGMNWQHCRRQTFFPSHSFEQYYQCVRRSYRFGQDKPVSIDIVATEGDANVLRNFQRKTKAANHMFDMLVNLMRENSLDIHNDYNPNYSGRLPNWLISNH